MLKVGQAAPVFASEDQDGNAVSSGNLKGTPYAIIFYPKDDTPGWTKQLCSIRDGSGPLQAHDIEVFGVSYDTREEHRAFREKFQLTTPLLMDEDRKLGAAFGIRTEGYPERKTFVINAKGKVAAIIDQIDFENHSTQIIDALG